MLLRIRGLKSSSFLGRPGVADRRKIAVPRWDGERSRFIAEGSGEIPLSLGLRALKLGTLGDRRPGVETWLAAKAQEVERRGCTGPRGVDRAAGIRAIEVEAAGRTSQIFTIHLRADG